jgi:hypothetical protein
MISINDVTKIDNKRKQMRKEIYIRIYEQFSRKLKQSVELGNKQVFLTVPMFVIGYPTFDRSSAARYIARQLKLGGFDVILISEFDLHVSWNIPKKNKEKCIDSDDDETCFPDLIDLKKMADKYRTRET